MSKRKINCPDFDALIQKDEDNFVKKRKTSKKVLKDICKHEGIDFKNRWDIPQLVKTIKTVKGYSSDKDVYRFVFQKSIPKKTKKIINQKKQWSIFEQNVIQEFETHVTKGATFTISKENNGLLNIKTVSISFYEITKVQEDCFFAKITKKKSIRYYKKDKITEKEESIYNVNQKFTPDSTCYDKGHKWKVGKEHVSLKWDN